MHRRVFIVVTLLSLGLVFRCEGQKDTLKPIAALSKPTVATRPVDNITQDLAETTRNDLAALTFPLDQPSPELELATKQTLETLNDLHLPQPAASGAGKPHLPHLLFTADQRGVLVGDFARDGGLYALVELPPGEYHRNAGAAFARFQAGHWRLLQLWRVQITWHPAGWKPEEDEPSMFGAAQRPFWTEHLDGDSAVWVVMAGDLGRFHQSDYVLRFDAGKQWLQLLTVSFQGEPRFLPGGWLELFYDSGHRVIWNEAQFLRWTDGILLPSLIWFEETPYNNVDPPFVDAEVFNDKGRLRHSYVGTYVPQDNDREMKIMITRNGRKFGAVRFIWLLPPDDLEKPVSNNLSDAGTAFLFERLTGLSRRLYLGDKSDNDQPVPKLENVARVQVEGGAEARRLLGVPAPKKTR